MLFRCLILWMIMLFMIRLLNHFFIFLLILFHFYLLLTLLVFPHLPHLLLYLIQSLLLPLFLQPSLLSQHRCLPQWVHRHGCCCLLITSVFNRSLSWQSSRLGRRKSSADFHFWVISTLFFGFFALNIEISGHFLSFGRSSIVRPHPKQGLKLIEVVGLAVQIRLFDARVGLVSIAEAFRFPCSLLQLFPGFLIFVRFQQIVYLSRQTGDMLLTDAK